MKKPLYFFVVLLFNLAVVQFAYGGPGPDPTVKSSGAIRTEAATADSVTINLPRTGAKTSFGTGDDGYLKRGAVWPDPRFTVGGDCITDNLTGLMWQKNADLAAGKKNWFEALDYAGKLNLCGFTDWRLPNVNELETLVNAEQPNTALWLNEEGFLNVQSGGCWSSTTYADNKDYAWFVDMQHGNVGNVRKAVGNYALPVRAEHARVPVTGQTKCYDEPGAGIACANTGQDGEFRSGVKWPDPRFNVAGDCITDNLTGLMWPKNANLANGARNWSEALNYAGKLNLCGFTDWRLPNRKELFSLLDYSGSNPSLQAGHPFVNVQPEYYWSSTTYAAATNSSWFVNLWYGFTHHYFKAYEGFILPVRDAGRVTGKKSDKD
jgi:hypothetical protein